MITPYIVHDADGANDTFPVPFPYLHRSHVKVFLNDVEQGSGAYSWATASSIKFTSPPASGADAVRFERRTPTAPLVTFKPSAALTVEDLQTEALQSLYRLEEMEADADRSLKVPRENAAVIDTELPPPVPLAPLVWDATGTKLRNGDPSLTGDMLLRGELAAATGAALVKYKQGGAGAITRDVGSKLTDAVSVKDYGAVGDGVADDTAAIQAALTAAAGKGLYFPGGVYLCGGDLAVTGDCCLIGPGAGLCEIRFNSATPSEQGIRITLTTDPKDYVHISGLALSTTNGYASGKTAIRIDGSAQLTGTYPSRLIANRSYRRGEIEDVVVRGESTTSGWDVGIQLVSVGWFNIHNYTFWGEDSEGSATGDWQGVGIRLQGEGVPTEFHFSSLWIHSAYYGVFTTDRIEGLYLTDFDFVNVRYGLYSNYVSGISVLPEANCAILQPTIGPGHIKCFLGGIVGVNVNQALIRDLNIYVASQPGYVNYFGISLANGANNFLHDITITDLGGSTDASWGVLFDNIDRSFIRSVAAYGFKDSAVYLKNDSDDNIVSGCLAYDMINIAIADATSGSNWFIKNKGMNLSGSAYGGTTTSNNHVEQLSYRTSVVKTLTGGAASEVVNLAIPSGVLPTKPTVVLVNAEADSQNLVCIPQQQAAGTTNLNVEVKVMRNDGAALAGGLARFHMVAYE